nr:hypothetical protein [Escherichia coli O25b:H4-ST131]
MPCDLSGGLNDMDIAVALIPMLVEHFGTPDVYRANRLLHGGIYRNS